MVTHHPDVIVQRVKPEDHRAGFVVFKSLDKVALDGVAGIDQDHVGLLRAYLLHLSGDLAQAAGQVFGVGRIIPGHKGTVQIGRAEDGDIDWFRSHCRGTQAKQNSKECLLHYHLIIGVEMNRNHAIWNTSLPVSLQGKK
ncbi:hypothetical protein D3C72_1182580 [compost metagenome]